MGNNTTRDRVLAYVQEHAKGKGAAELAEMTNRELGTSFTAKQMKAFKQRHGIKSGIRPKPPTPFTQEMRAYIFANCAGVSWRDMAEIVNKLFETDIPAEKFRWFYQNNKLKSGIHTSGNKAAPGEVSKKKNDYQYIKMEDGSWRLYHHVLWEQANGPIPPGYMLTFIDGDIQNVDLSNLELVSRKELFLLAKDNLRFGVPELNKVGILIAKVRAAASEKEKQAKKNE